MTNHSRRDFIKYTSVAMGSILLNPLFVHADSGYRFLSEAHRQCLIALCEQIIPRDDFPGATDVGVIHYIEKQISGVFKQYSQTYIEGLTNLQAFCKDEMNDKFVNLSSEIQLDVMTKMESNQIPRKTWPQGNPKSFFNLVVKHTMQGFYGSPQHGGNKDHASFKMLNLGYPLTSV